VHWKAPLFDATGYRAEARAFVRGIDELGCAIEGLDLRRLIRRVASRRGEAPARGRLARDTVAANCDVGVISERVAARIEALA
jgi:hypothetical protein